jgi:hypothetical protein
MRNLKAWIRRHWAAYQTLRRLAAQRRQTPLACLLDAIAAMDRIESKVQRLLDQGKANDPPLERL